MKIRKQNARKNLALSALLVLVSLTRLLSTQAKSTGDDIRQEPDIEHVIVFYEHGRFGGWPANHGIWAWDNEILVGFVAADHKEKTGHTYDASTARSKYARSYDGGHIWVIEDASEHGQTAWGHDNNLGSDIAVVPVQMNRSIEDCTNTDFVLTFLRHNNHNGPSHFYYSNNRGSVWEGPFIFPDLNTNGVATRTDYIVESRKEVSVFLTVAKSNGKEGRVALARTKNGGLDWEIVSWIGPEPEGFDIMPSSLRLSPTELITVIRSRSANGQDYLSSHISTDNGLNWNRQKDPVADTGKGGSPPALVKLRDGRLALAYIYRSQYGSRVNVRFSSDNGVNWSNEIVLRCCDGATRDGGYPRMVQRPDGKLVLIYYWNNANIDKSKPYRYIAATIFDPAFWK